MRFIETFAALVPALYFGGCNAAVATVKGSGGNVAIDVEFVSADEHARPEDLRVTCALDRAHRAPDGTWHSPGRVDEVPADIAVKDAVGAYLAHRAPGWNGGPGHSGTVTLDAVAGEVHLQMERNPHANVRTGRGRRHRNRRDRRSRNRLNRRRRTRRR